MTEDEAKKKWCPMVRLIPTNRFHVATSQTSYNRGYNTDDGKELLVAGTTCIGIYCMMWQMLSPKEGYCGLGKGPYL